MNHQERSIAEILQDARRLAGLPQVPIEARYDHDWEGNLLPLEQATPYMQRKPDMRNFDRLTKIRKRAREIYKHALYMSTQLGKSVSEDRGIILLMESIAGGQSELLELQQLAAQESSAYQQWSDNRPIPLRAGSSGWAIRYTDYETLENGWITSDDEEPVLYATERDAWLMTPRSRTTDHEVVFVRGEE